MCIARLRQAVNHPLLVMSKASKGGDEDKDDILSMREGDAEDIKQMIADFASGREAKDDTIDAEENESPASQTIQSLKEGETRLCLFCQEEVEAEVILPCFHTG
jgi:hypothetical protein